MGNQDNREIITIQSSQSAEPANNKNLNNKESNRLVRTHDVIDLIDDEEEIIVGSAQHREYNRQYIRREKERIRRRKREKRRNRKRSSKGSSKYPRKCKINGIKWKRKYAKEEKRYYWVQKNNE